MIPSLISPSNSRYRRPAGAATVSRLARQRRNGIKWSEERDADANANWHALVNASSELYHFANFSPMLRFTLPTDTAYLRRSAPFMSHLADSVIHRFILAIFFSPRKRGSMFYWRWFVCLCCKTIGGVRLFVRLFPLYLLNRLTFELGY